MWCSGEVYTASLGREGPALAASHSRQLAPSMGLGLEGPPAGGMSPRASSRHRLSLKLSGKVSRARPAHDSDAWPRMILMLGACDFCKALSCPPRKFIGNARMSDVRDSLYRSPGTRYVSSLEGAIMSLASQGYPMLPYVMSDLNANATTSSAMITTLYAIFSSHLKTIRSSQGRVVKAG